MAPSLEWPECAIVGIRDESRPGRGTVGHTRQCPVLNLTDT